MFLPINPNLGTAKFQRTLNEKRQQWKRLEPWERMNLRGYRSTEMEETQWPEMVFILKYKASMNYMS